MPVAMVAPPRSTAAVLQAGLPPGVQLPDEVLYAAPEDADLGVLEVALQIALGQVGLQDAVALRVDLHGDVLVLAPPPQARLVLEAPEQHAEVPVAHLV